MQVFRIFAATILVFGVVSGLPVTQEDQAATTTVPAVIFERQEEGGATEISTGAIAPNAEDDSDEASSETVTEAAVKEAVTALPKVKVPLKTTFNQEWNIVTSSEIQSDQAEPAVDDEDNEVNPNPSGSAVVGTKKVDKPFVDEKATTFEQEWAYVNGNASAVTKPPKKSTTTQAPKASESTTSTTARTFHHEWEAVNGLDADKAQEQEPAQTDSPKASEGVTEAPGVDEEEEEEDEEEAAVTEAPVVTITSSTKKPFVVGTIGEASFQKEWAVVTGDVVNAGQIVKNNNNESSSSSAAKARAECECGRVPFQVSGGGVNEWPWTAAIVRHGFIAGGRPHCGATLINNKYVLTSANCMDGLLPDRTEVWVTVHDSLQEKSTSGTLKLQVDKILMHPNYNRRTSENDIALVRLQEPLNIGERYYFVPACVPAGRADYAGTMGKMAAWGSAALGVYNQRVSNNKICKADMPILSNEVCNRDTRHVGKITKNMVCAGFVTPTQETSCISDAGGGLIIRNGGRHTLVGVTSFGYSPNRAYSPTVHTRVSEYAEWILHNTRDGEWCD